MAQRPSPTQPVSDHYLSQTGLTVALGNVLASLWPSLDFRDLDGSLPAYKARFAALVRQFALSSAALAARDYQRERVAAGIRSSFTTPAPNLPPLEQIDKKVNWAVADLWGDDVFTDRKVAESAQHNLEGGAVKLVLDTGRDLTIQAVQEDRQARAWARETQPGCCYWCAALAGRGAVYKSARSAGEGNDFHNHDKCVVVPVFGEYEPTAHARQWAADWQRLKDLNGGHLSMTEWRQFFEERLPTDSPLLAGP